MRTELSWTSEISFCVRETQSSLSLAISLHRDCRQIGRVEHIKSHCHGTSFLREVL